jgi:hypothetical protein
MDSMEGNTDTTASPGGRAEGSSNSLNSEELKRMEQQVEARVRKEIELKMGQEDGKRDKQAQLYQILLAKEIGKALTGLKTPDMPPLSVHVTPSRYLAELDTLTSFSNADEAEKIRLVIKAAQKCSTMGPKLVQWKTRAGLSDSLTWANLKIFLLQLQQEKVDDGVYEDALNSIVMAFDSNGALEGGISYVQKIWVLYYLKMESLQQTITGVVGSKVALGVFRDIHRYALRGLPSVILDKDLYDPKITEGRFVEIVNTSIRCQTQRAIGRSEPRSSFFKTPNGKTSFKMDQDITCPSFGGNIRDENPVSEQEITISSKQRTKNWARLESYGLMPPSAMKRRVEDSDDDGEDSEGDRRKKKAKNLREREAKNKLAEEEDKEFKRKEDELDKKRETEVAQKRTSIRVREQAAMAAEKEELCRANAELRASVTEMQCFVQAQRRFQQQPGPTQQPIYQQMYQQQPNGYQQQGPNVHPDRQPQLNQPPTAPLQQPPVPTQTGPPTPRLPKEQRNVTPILASSYKCTNVNCGQVGHLILECKADKKGICNSCGKLNSGHYAKTCPDTLLACANCGKNHRYNDCPYACGCCTQRLHGIFHCAVRAARVKADQAARTQRV